MKLYATVFFPQPVCPYPIPKYKSITIDRCWIVRYDNPKIQPPFDLMILKEINGETFCVNLCGFKTFSLALQYANELLKKTIDLK